MAAFIVLACQARATNVNPFTNLGSAGPSNWQILSLGNCSSGACDKNTTNVTISNSSEVDGNVGVAPKGNLNVDNSSEVYGNASVDTQGSVTYAWNVSGTVTQNSSTNTLLDNAATAAMSAYSAASGDSATSVTCSGTGCSTTNDVNPTHAITFTGTSGINVVDLTNLELNNSADGLTLSAPTGAVFVINISGTFSVTNGADIKVAGGLSQLNVLYNVEGTGSAVSFSDSSDGTNVQGVVLAPYRDITLNGAQVDGEIISGNLNITVENNSTVDVPEPASLILLASGLAGLGVRMRQTGK